MGDLIMSGPAIRALKESFSARITVLTSSMAAGIAASIPEIDDVIIFDVPWVKTKEATGTQIPDIVDQISKKQFDAAVIFTVYSQNPLPTAMLAYMAGIPKVLAYCRENPYGLLTDWVPDKEPYKLIKHQVRRDLDLVKTIGASPSHEDLSLAVNYNLWPGITEKLKSVGVNLDKPWLILHPGVSEIKRQYPIEKWIESGERLIDELDYQLLFTGTLSEKDLIDQIIGGTGKGCFSLSGKLNLEELACLIKHSQLLLSVNTGTVHIAAAVNTPVVVLYAETNPQHTPWNVPHKVLPFAVTKELKSKNEIIAYVDEKLYSGNTPTPGPDDIVSAVLTLLSPAGLSLPPSHEIQGENPAMPAS